MGQSGKRRQRAVRLTAMAVGKLNARLVEVWQDSSSGGRLTRGAKAALMGVSVGTADRILGCKGNDRSVLVVVFAELSIPWEERFCEPLKTNQNQGIEEFNRLGLAQEDINTKANERAQRKMRSGTIALSVLALLGVGTLGLIYAKRSNIRVNSGFEILEAGRKAYWDANYEVAVTKANKSLEIGITGRNPDVTANAYLLLGDAFAAKGELETSRKNYIKSLALWTTFEHKHGMSSLLEVLAVTEARMGLLSEASQHFNDSLMVVKGEGAIEDPPGTIRGLGSVAALKGNLKLARQLYDAAEQSSRRTKPDDPLPIDIRALRALLLRDEGNFQESLKELRECLKYWSRVGHERWVASTMRQIATVYYRMDDDGKANEFAKEAYRLYENVGDKLNALECTEMMANGLPYCLTPRCLAEDYF